MEGNCSQLPSAGNIGCGRELARSNLDATTSSLAAENCEDMRSLENGLLDNPSEWTDEKHNSYLRNLEVSFVKQLHQSKALVACCSEQSQRGQDIFQKHQTNARNTSEQFNVLWNCCWPNINDARCEHLVRIPLVRKRLHNNSCMGMLGSPPPSADMPKFRKLCNVMKYRKRMISREFSPNKPYHEYLLDSNTEGMGQNFLDEDDQILSGFKSRVKRLKTVSADSSVQDQIAPLKNCLRQELVRMILSEKS